MEIIERYVYAVVSKLPEKQRDDIAKEIRTLIDDMKEKYSTEEDEKKKVEKVLLELGNPNLLAEQYSDRKRYLIGPKNFNKYVFVLKIVLSSVILGITIASLVEGIFISNDNLALDISSYFTKLFSGLFQGFTWVTIIFASLEYQGVVIEPNRGKIWDLKQLSPIPHKKAVISRTESVVSIIFISIFTIILYFYPSILGAYIKENNERIVIPIFNLENWDKFKILIIGLFLIGIAREMLKFIYGKWDLRLAIYYSALTISSMILFIITFSNTVIWNTNFGKEVVERINLDVNFTLSTQKSISVFIIVVVIINLFEIGTALYKGIKYNVSKD